MLSHSVPNVQRLSPDTQMSLRELSELLGERGHALIWASNFLTRNGFLPTSSQIVLGLERDLGVRVSGKSADRALAALREGH